MKIPKITQIVPVREETQGGFDPSNGAPLEKKEKTFIFGLGADNKVYLWDANKASFIPTWTNDAATPAPKGRSKRSGSKKKKR